MIKEKNIKGKNQLLNFNQGKEINKLELCKKFNLDENKPLFAFIGRLVYEKGADLLPGVAYKKLLNQELNLLVLGSGNQQTEAELLSLRAAFRRTYHCEIAFDETLAHKIYAGADFLLMPSRVEPCGLNQLYALKYGTIPVVRRIGGLKDTVIDIGDGGFGICHVQATVEDICASIDRALDLYKDQQEFSRIRKKCMKIDHSWAKSVKEYLTLYESIIEEENV